MKGLTVLHTLIKVASLRLGYILMNRSYWLNLFTFETWTEFLAAGASISGFREKRWPAVQKMQTGDILLCYLTGISRWVGALEVTGPAFFDSKPLWTSHLFPVRIPVKLVAALELECAVPVLELRHQLSIFSDLKSANAWTGRFRGSPSRWSTDDGEAVLKAIKNALSNPNKQPFDHSKLRRIPPILKDSKLSSKTESEGTIEQPSENFELVVECINNLPKEESAHTEIQWLLLRLGAAMGLDLWVATNDKNRIYKGTGFSSITGIKDSLPLQFDDATRKTIEMIDVLWLKGNAIQAAFEIESTTSIYSGLLRMSDLIAMQPNLNIPLFIVAPSERKTKVIAEVNRPTFARLTPAMSKICRYISFEELKKQVSVTNDFMRFLKPEFLHSFSQSCET